MDKNESDVREEQRRAFEGIRVLADRAHEKAKAEALKLYVETVAAARKLYNQ